MVWRQIANPASPPPAPCATVCHPTRADPTARRQRPSRARHLARHSLRDGPGASQEGQGGASVTRHSTCRIVPHIQSSLISSRSQNAKAANVCRVKTRICHFRLRAGCGSLWWSLVSSSVGNEFLGPPWKLREEWTATSSRRTAPHALRPALTTRTLPQQPGPSEARLKHSRRHALTRQTF